MTLTMAFVYAFILLLFAWVAGMIALSLKNAKLMDKYE